MFHRVLDDRLKDQIWDACLEYGGIDLYVGCKTILESDSFNFQITVQEFNFLSQCDFHRAGVFESQAQEVAEACNHFASAFRVFAQQCGDRMKCVEQEMRLHLHLQSFELRLDELRAKLRRFEFSFAVTVVVVEGVAHQQYQPVDEQPPVEIGIQVSR